MMSVSPEIHLMHGRPVGWQFARTQSLA
jgi:hypothetical protein